MAKNYSKHRQEIKNLALERIRTLFSQAEKKFKIDPKLSDRYVWLAKKICSKAQIMIPSKYRKRYCKNCLKYLVPSINCTVRIVKGNVIYHCHNCRKMMKFGYLREKKSIKKIFIIR